MKYLFSNLVKGLGNKFRGSESWSSMVFVECRHMILWKTKVKSFADLYSRRGCVSIVQSI